MIFASDLDRTLIYSEKFLEMHPTQSKLIEADYSKTISYITDSALEKLKDLNSRPNFNFIPVTTRSVLEYNRVNLFGLEPEYAIVANGGKILHFGKPMKEWEEHIAASFDYSMLEKIAEDLNKFESVYYRAKIVDDCFVFSKSNDLRRSQEELQELAKKYPEFIFYLDKHKIFGIPKVCSKGNALTWIKTKMGEKTVVAAGDGPLDVSFMNVSDVAVVPYHKTFDLTVVKCANVIELEQFGADSADKILDVVDKYVQLDSIQGR